MTVNRALSPAESRRVSRAWSKMHQAGNSYRACPQDESRPSTTLACAEYRRQVLAYESVLGELGIDKPMFPRAKRGGK